MFSHNEACSAIPLGVRVLAQAKTNELWGDPGQFEYFVHFLSIRGLRLDTAVAP